MIATRDLQGWTGQLYAPLTSITIKLAGAMSTVFIGPTRLSKPPPTIAQILATLLNPSWG